MLVNIFIKVRIGSTCTFIKSIGIFILFLGGILAESPAYQGLEWESSQSNPGQKVIVEVFEGIDIVVIKYS